MDEQIKKLRDRLLNNLDNWKSSRRKRVEHIIERCVEVRRMEHEPSQPRAKSKTFNEMLEERSVLIYNSFDNSSLSNLKIDSKPLYQSSKQR
ncbi:hypothetical protein HF086_006024 [Spodoptera exigua]|uniref:DUF4757 domain-containing protein n=1 Tax=Spodoptera exigua TaxID=7107 RepID=A0A922SP12_SPOEX|nr:hypothetical protein HF086_006024 [Spodoptera exigua]